MKNLDKQNKKRQNILAKLRKTGTIFMVLAITIGLASCSILPKEQNVQAPPLVTPAKVDYTMAEVKKGTLIKNLSGLGNFISVNQQNAYLEYGRGGNLVQILVRPGDKVKAGQVLAQVDSGSIENQIKEQELVIKRAELEYERCVANKADSYSLKLAEVDLQLSKLQLENLMEELEKTKIIAKISGRIVYSSYSKLGDYIEPYKTIFAIANTGDLQVEYKGSNAMDFKVGMEADLFYNGQGFKGIVAATPSTKPEGTGKEGDRVIISLKDLPKDAQIGDSVQINVELLKKENVLMVDKAGVHEYQNQIYVEVLEDNIKVEKYIKIGADNGSEVEIISGLSEGDKIISK